MQIVIGIPKYIYDTIIACDGYISDCDNEKVGNAIKNSTPLPKGHGRLIDADDIAVIDEQFYVPSDYYVAESAIDDAPTIIEADKEQES